MSIQSLSQGSSLGGGDGLATENVDNGNKNPSPLSTPSSRGHLKSPGSTGRAVEKLRDEREGLLGEVGNLNNKVNEMVSEENMLRTRLIRAEERIDELKADLRRSSDESEQMSGLLSVRTSEATELRNELEHVRGALALAQESLSDKTQKLSAIESRGNNAAALSRLEKEKNYLEETLSSLNSELSSARKEKFQISLKYDELVHGELRTLRTDCESLSETVETLTAELTELRGKSMTLESECGRYSDELESSRAKARNLQRQCEESDHKYKETSSELTRAMSTIVQLQGVVRHLQSDEDLMSSQLHTSQLKMSSPGTEDPASPSGTSVSSGGALISPSVRGKAAEMNSLRKQLADERALTEKLNTELSNLQREGIASRQQQVVGGARSQALETELRSMTQVRRLYRSVILIIFLIFAL